MFNLSALKKLLAPTNEAKALTAIADEANKARSIDIYTNLVSELRKYANFGYYEYRTTINNKFVLKKLKQGGYKVKCIEYLTYDISWN